MLMDLPERGPQLVKSRVYYLLLLLHAGTNDMACQNLVKIKEDYKALGMQVKNIGVQVIFSVIFTS